MIPLRKVPFFFRHYREMETMNKMGEYEYIKINIMFKQLPFVHGYIYRVKKLRTKTEVKNLFCEWFFPKGELGLMKELFFHKHKEKIFQIIELYKDE